MKILFLAREIPYPADSGVKMRAWHVLKALADKHDVTLVCYGHPQGSLDDVLLNTCESVHVIKPLKAARGIGLYLNMLGHLFDKRPYAVQGRYLKAYDRKVQELIQNKTYDLVVCDSLYQAIYVPQGAFKTLLNEHNIESVIIDRFVQLQKSSLVKWYAQHELRRMKQFEDAMWRQFDISFVCSRVDQDMIKNRVDSLNIKVIPNGIHLPEEVYSETKTKHIVYTGLIGWRPNADAVHFFVQQIYPLIQAKDPEVRLLIVGKNPSASIQNYAKQDDSITVTGFVDSVTPYVRDAAVMIVPLRIGSGTRLKILEAFSMKKAVVSTSIGAEGLDVEHQKHLMLADDPESFARAVLDVLHDDTFRAGLGENGRTLVEEKYTWDVIGQTIEQVVKEL